MPRDDKSVTTADISSAAAGTDMIVCTEELEKQKITCSLCSCTLNSETQAQAHFSGVRHRQQMERHGLPMTDGASVDKLVKHHRKTQQSGKRYLKLVKWFSEFHVLCHGVVCLINEYVLIKL